MTRFVLRPGCATGPPSTLNDAWTFINVVLHDFELMLPVSSGSFFTDDPSVARGTTAGGRSSVGRAEAEHRDQMAMHGQDVSDVVFVKEFGVWSEDLDEVISELPATGLRLRARTLRAGWFFGGDNERHLILDFIRTSAGCVNSATVSVCPR